ncbi:MAG: hypothetical protein PHH68_01605 [Candidatus Omnitrophica bacterium]|nr:hypothetical protein [Candidatus Omnitrophota bacterium]MDD5079005.1 hypothetical protein [Candidatus Omnitrophota bacterium]
MNKVIAVIVLILAGVLSGCQTFSSGNSANESFIEPAARFKFSDIPVPSGFKSLPQESYSFDNGGVRVAVLKYQGKADPDQMVAFYKEQMKMNQWEMINVTEFGQRMLNFNNESEACIISLLPKGRLITLVISVGPRAERPGVKKSKEALK